MKYLLYIFIGLSTIATLAQDIDVPDTPVVDSLYREDQVYVGITFNLLSNKPSGFEQNGLSAGVQAGVIRDFPLNKRRNKAIGIGIGMALDTYNQNLLIAAPSGSETSTFAIVDESVENVTNRFTSYTLEMPLEYRWRTSTATKYSFWRIHVGMKLGYVLRFKSTYQDDVLDVAIKDIPEINKFQYGPSFSFGYGAFNFQGYYGLNTLFNDDALLNTEEVGIQVMRLGLVFYFL
ncbi:porin family protein [Dokdonia genika]|uniref:Porin family protein n=1 Tax=Dokdonia genika TaxID=308113 RepID=A0ABV9L683_9FLAO|nr:porin family protein [Dokdonia donghaensis]